MSAGIRARKSGQARLVAASPEDVTLLVRARNVRVTGLVLDAPPTAQIVAESQATLTIDHSTIGGAERGIVVSTGGRAVVTGSTFDAQTNDLVLLDDSTAVLSPTDPDPLLSTPNRSTGLPGGIRCFGGSIAGSLGRRSGSPSAVFRV